VVQPDVAFALGVEFLLEGDRAERQGGGIASKAACVMAILIMATEPGTDRPVLLPT
jgi:hypothetical protein